MRRSRFIFLASAAWALWALSPGAGAQVSAPPVRIEQVAARMVEMDRQRMAALTNYVAVRRYVLDNPRFHNHAEMTVRMTYAYPGKKEFEVLSESGSVWIRKYVLKKMLQAELESGGETMRKQTSITAANYEFRLVGSQEEGGRLFQLIDCTPRTANKYLFRGRIWLDAEDAAVARIEGSPAQLPSIWTREVRFVHRYDKHGAFWLPASNHSETQVRIFGATTVRIDYFDYRINLPPAEFAKVKVRNRVRQADLADPPPEN